MIDVEKAQEELEDEKMATRLNNERLYEK